MLGHLGPLDAGFYHIRKKRVCANHVTHMQSTVPHKNTLITHYILTGNAPYGVVGGKNVHKTDLTFQSLKCFPHIRNKQGYGLIM